MKFTSSESQAVIKMNDNEEYDYIFMPIRADIEAAEEVYDDSEETQEDEEVKKETAA
jgi:hypothetical protein